MPLDVLIGKGQCELQLSFHEFLERIPRSLYLLGQGRRFGGHLTAFSRQRLYISDGGEKGRIFIRDVFRLRSAVWGRSCAGTAAGLARDDVFRMDSG